jgi:predicted outer membrane protein
VLRNACSRGACAGWTSNGCGCSEYETHPLSARLGQTLFTENRATLCAVEQTERLSPRSLNTATDTRTLVNRAIEMKDIFSAVWLALAVAFVMESLTETQAQTALGPTGTLSRGRTQPHSPVGISEFTAAERDVDRTRTTRGMKLSPRDQRLVQEAYERGLFETGAAQLALENSSVLVVHLLAQQIVVNRAQIDEQLKTLAEMKGMAALSAQLDSNHHDTLERLANASQDGDFDLRYCATVVSGHIRDIKALQSAAARGSDADFKTLADAIVASLKQQLAIALAIQRELANALNEEATIDV